jgi:hypothetical protein
MQYGKRENSKQSESMSIFVRQIFALSLAALMVAGASLSSDAAPAAC